MALFVRTLLLFLLSTTLGYWLHDAKGKEQREWSAGVVKTTKAEQVSEFSSPESKVAGRTLLQVIQQPTPYQRALRLILSKREHELKTWLQEDLDAVAVGLRASMTEGGAYVWERGEALSEFMKLYARKDTAKALAWAQGLPLLPLRSDLAPLGYAVLAEGDLASVLNTIDQSHSPGVALQMKERCVSNLAEQDPAGAMAWLAEYGTRGSADGYAMRAALKKHGFKELWSMLTQLEEGAGKRHLKEALLSEGWGREGMLQVLKEEAAAGRLPMDFFHTATLSPEEAEASWQATFGVLPEKLRADLAKAALRQLIGGKGLAAAWADERWLHTDAHRHYVLSAVVEAYEQEDSGLKSAQMLQQMQASIPKDLHSDLLQRLMANTLSGEAAKRLWPWVQQKGEPELIARFSQKVKRSGKEAASAWLRGVTNPQVRDAALLGSLADVDREEALMVLPQFRQPAARMAAVKSIAVQWMNENESAALAWLKAQGASAADVTAVRQAVKHGSDGGTFLPNGEWLPE